MLSLVAFIDAFSVLPVAAAPIGLACERHITGCDLAQGKAESHGIAAFPVDFCGMTGGCINVGKVWATAPGREPGMSEHMASSGGGGD
jgi:hypothetical protein